MKKYLGFFFVLLLLLGCGTTENKENTVETEEKIPYWQATSTGVKNSLRGLAAVSDSVAWASGSGGMVLRTTDAGTTWQQRPIPGADTLDFRDIQAFDDQKALVLSAGLPATIYLTKDGGQTWEQTYFSNEPGTFYDAMDFWNDQEGIAFGDAVEGRLLILKTQDGGASWQPLPYAQRPIALPGQGGFAASGTCLRTVGEKQVYIGLGGIEASLFYSFDKGETWQKTITPLQSGVPTAGIFSIDFLNKNEGLMVGGDYRGDSLTNINAAYTTDAGHSWFPLRAEHKPKGYRSAVAFLQNGWVLAVGRESADYRKVGDEQFTTMEGQYYAVSVTENGESAWASGAQGRVARLGWR